LVLAAALAFACSGDDGDADSGGHQDVSGAWCGKEVAAASDCVGDEVIYLELEQDGATITGQYCEAFGHECYALAGSVEGSQLTFEYHFSEYTVTATLLIGSSLKGSFFSTKCACEIPVEVFGID
jgi:hypothetical protein